MKSITKILIGLFLFSGLYAQELAPDYELTMYKNQSIDFELYDEADKHGKHDKKHDEIDFEVELWPEHGYITNNEGVITYSPDIGWEGTDSFLYSLTTGKGKNKTSDEGIVTIIVSGEPVVTDTTWIWIPDTVTVTVTEYISVDTLIFLFDTTFITVTQTVYDTSEIPVYVYDTTYVPVFVDDTTYTPVVVYDTTHTLVFVYDTNWVFLDLVVYDTTITPFVFIDTSMIPDTIIVTRTVLDTVYFSDTLWVADFDTVYFYDTLLVYRDVHDTLYIENVVIDTLVFVDTLYMPPDTFIVSVHDTLFFPPDTVILPPDTMFILLLDSMFIDIVNTDTSWVYLGVLESEFVPGKYALHPNYPNPFNPITTIRFDMPRNDLINITVYDLGGRKILELENNYLNAGVHQVVWNGTYSNGEIVPSGIYFVRLVSPVFTHTLKITLLK